MSTNPQQVLPLRLPRCPAAGRTISPATPAVGTMMILGEWSQEVLRSSSQGILGALAMGCFSAGPFWQV